MDKVRGAAYESDDPGLIAMDAVLDLDNPEDCADYFAGRLKPDDGEHGPTSDVVLPMLRDGLGAPALDSAAMGDTHNSTFRAVDRETARAGHLGHMRLSA